MFHYTASQLVRYHAHCRANPDSPVLPPGGRAHWDDMPAGSWLSWFWSCLTAKINRGMPEGGKGNRAKRRAQAMADARAECKWCGTKTGSVRREFCEASCASAYRG